MIRVTAHAKINFFLEITGKRPDNYHTLSIVFQTISLGDKLVFEPARGLSLTCSEAALPTDERNLVMKAAIRLRQALKETQGAKIHLEKKIPMGAGLGGGSSDAAAVLTTLPVLWGRRIRVSALNKLAAGLGADVPFFLKGGLCSATGIGDQLKSLKPLPKIWLVLVYPGFGVSTKEAYSKIKLPLSDTRKLKKAVIASGAKHSVDDRLLRRFAPRNDGLLFNRFEEFIFPDHPELPRLKQDLLQAGATGALMSGSGSAIFGLAKTRADGQKIFAQVQRRYPQSWLVHTL